MVTLSCNHSSNDTPSVSPFGLPAPPLGSQEGCNGFAWDFIKPWVPAATPQSAPLGLPAQLCIKQLYAALWSATPAKPFRGAKGETNLPFQGRFSRCPLWGKCREAAKGVSLVTLSCCHSSYHTPSVRPFGLPAPPLGSQEGCNGFAQVFIRT